MTHSRRRCERDRHQKRSDENDAAKRFPARRMVIRHGDRRADNQCGGNDAQSNAICHSFEFVERVIEAFMPGCDSYLATLQLAQ